jgi:hypothetical protein
VDEMNTLPDMMKCRLRELPNSQGGRLRNPTWPEFRSGPLSHCLEAAHFVSDFRKVGLKRQVLNFDTLDPDVAIGRLMQLYKCHNSFIF